LKDKKGTSPDRRLLRFGDFCFLEVLKIIQILIHEFFQAGAVFYLISLLMNAGKFTAWSGRVFKAGLACNLVSLVLRCWVCFPFIPLYQTAFFLPFTVGLAGIVLLPCLNMAWILPVNVLAWSACFFPNDFYLPFIQSQSIFSHGLFVFGIMGRAMFFLSGTAGACFLVYSGEKKRIAGRAISKLVLWGFFFWTLSVFSGGVWAWLGWGSPIVWDDPLIACSMATWVLYAFVLHLNLTRFAGLRSKAWFALAACLFMFFVNCVLEAGPFRLPEFLS